MGDAQGPTHCDIVAEPVGLSLLETRRCPGFHHTSDISHKLTDTRAYFTGTYPDDHALGVAHVDLAIEIRTLGALFGAGTRVGSFFGSSFRHIYG